jgi:predicted XRE-type DNA-binding protein
MRLARAEVTGPSSLGLHGSDNLGQDFGYPDADIRHAKGRLAAKVIGALDDRELSTRKAAELTGFAAADFSRVRNADYGRFTLDRLIRMLHVLDRNVEIELTVRARAAGAQPAPRQAEPTHRELNVTPSSDRTIWMKQQGALANALTGIALSSGDPRVAVARRPRMTCQQSYWPTLLSTSALRKRSITIMNSTEGTSRIRAVIEAIW